MTSDFVFEIYDKLDLNPDLRKLLLIHSRAVADKALSLASECGLAHKIDMQFVEDAAMLHDVGVVKTNAPSIFCYGELPYICHGVEGRKILDGFLLPEKYGLVCERHTGSGITLSDVVNNNLPLPPADYIPVSLEEKLICFADKFFSKSHDPEREKNIEEVRRSMLKFGHDAYQRFSQLEILFTPKNVIK